MLYRYIKTMEMKKVSRKLPVFSMHLRNLFVASFTAVFLNSCVMSSKTSCVWSFKCYWTLIYKPVFLPNSNVKNYSFIGQSAVQRTPELSFVIRFLRAPPNLILHPYRVSSINQRKRFINIINNSLNSHKVFL